MNQLEMDAQLDITKQEALEFAGIGLYQYRFDGTILSIDRGALRIFDLEEFYPDPNAVVGKNIGELIQYIYPPGTLRGQVRLYGHVRNLELTLLTLAGKFRWVSHDAKIIHEAKTGEQVVQVIIQDVTVRKQAEESLRQAYADMEMQVQARTASEREQRMMAEALRDISSLLNSTLQLDEVLDRILSEIQKVVPHDSANIMLVKDGEIRVVRDSDPKKIQMAGIEQARTFKLSELPIAIQMLNAKRAIVIEDTRHQPKLVIHTLKRMTIRSYLGAPIQHSGERIGFINLFSKETGFFKENQAERLQVFADQAAIAINNARLYTRAQELASLEERQRLARDLHDSVSQTLWTAALIAHVLPGNLETNPEEGRRNIDQLQRLTRGALAEMRTLLLELRPSALEEASLGDLLQQLSQSVMSRKSVDILVAIEGETSIPGRIKIGLYRLAQEAVNNAAKHAHATEVEICLALSAERIELLIRDNGRGFNLHQNPKGLGLNIMQERAEAIGAALEIFSEIDAGTTVKITWPAGQISRSVTL